MCELYTFCTIVVHKDNFMLGTCMECNRMLTGIELCKLYDLFSSSSVT